MLNVLDLWRDLICPYWWVYITLCLPSIHLHNESDWHEWIYITGHWRWGLHKRKCCSMLDCWNWSSSRYGTSWWYITLASLQMLNYVLLNFIFFHELDLKFIDKTFKKYTEILPCELWSDEFFKNYFGFHITVTLLEWWESFPYDYEAYDMPYCCNFFIVISCNIYSENNLWSLWSTTGYHDSNMVCPSFFKPHRLLLLESLCPDRLCILSPHCKLLNNFLRNITKSFILFLIS
jgi:hypothetical protein